MTVPAVLFVCVHNAGRSQMAAAFLRAIAGDAVVVRSAGSDPADRVNPVAVEAMREVGVDIADAVPALLEPEAVEASDVVVTMGCGDACPVLPGTSYRDWALEDPAGQGLEVVRRVRDEVHRRVRELVAELGLPAAPAGRHAAPAPSAWGAAVTQVDVRILPPDDAAARRAALDLVPAAVAADGHRPVSEETELAVRGGRSDVVVLAAGVEGDPVAGWAALDPAGTAELVVAPERRRRGVGAALAAALVEQAPGPLRAWAHGDLPGARALAARHGAAPVRLLHQMRRPLSDGLPAPVLPPGVALRGFVVGQDEEAWLRLNARAFADHPEQGRWTRADVDARTAEPWFDPDGLLLAERDGRLVGSHWTKTHPAREGAPAEGEVYVVAVDPDARGTGLGRALVLAGLAHLRGRGLAAVSLYVDDDNAPAVALYRRLGFAVAVTDVLWETRP